MYEISLSFLVQTMCVRGESSLGPRRRPATVNGPRARLHKSSTLLPFLVLSGGYTPVAWNWSRTVTARRPAQEFPSLPLFPSLPRGCSRETMADLGLKALQCTRGLLGQERLSSPSSSLILPLLSSRHTMRSRKSLPLRSVPT